MVNHVEQMLELNKALSAARTPPEKTSLERQIAATDTQIDRLVYDLYGLTEEEIQTHNPRFRRKIRAKGDKGRDYLWAFARHWLAGLIWERRPHIHALLPASYNCGHSLPPKQPVPPQAMLRPPRGAVRTPRPTINRMVPPPTRVRPRPDPGYAFAAAAQFHFP